jgi:hypothetical protein
MEPAGLVVATRYHGNAAKAPLIQSQLSELSAVLFPSTPPASGSRWPSAVGRRGGARRVA